MASRKFTDARMVGLLRDLARSDSEFWKSVADRLATPRNKRVAVNLSKLDRLAGKGLTLVVPGKVLGSGGVSGKLNVAAYSFSSSAVERIEGAGGTVMVLEELFESNPSGRKLKVVI
jgi:large subunit ribosomal protein L18e